MQHKKLYFGTDGIRGEANKVITPELALKVGQAAGIVFQRGDHRHRVVIGKDTRLSGYMIENALVAGFTSFGMDPLLLGPMPTPAVAMLTHSMRADLGVMISASHNHFQDNGLKLFGPDGYKLSDEIEKEIGALLDSYLSPRLAGPTRLGRAKRVEAVHARYIEFAKRTIMGSVELAGLRIVVDCANGAGYKVAPEALWELGAEVFAIGVEPDGFNINRDVGSTAPQALADKVREMRADIGIALDGDADRVIIVDEKGQVVDGDQLMAVIASSWNEEGRLSKPGIVATIMSNLGLGRFLESQGLSLIRSAVGDRHVLEEMRAHGYNVGGEKSGHIILSDFGTTGDGLVSALQLLAVLKRSGKPVSELCHCFEPVPQLLKNVRFKSGRPLETEPVKKVIELSREKLGKAGRLVIRPSGTEPVIRVMAEADDAALVATIVDEVCAAVAKVAWMCGIVGILGSEKAAPLVVEALKRLEYRGYDSAGVATLEDGHITRLRAEGKLRNLASKLDTHPLKGTIAIGHTRWATHGKPTENNAHPHATDKLAVVHNGIIENFRELRKMMEGEGIVFKTETDTEVVAQLVTRELATTNDPRTAVARALPQLRGAFALAFIFEGAPDLMIGARQGAPLAVGHGHGEMYLGSDALALAPFTDTITYLDDGDWVVLTRTDHDFRDAKNNKVARKTQKTSSDAFLVDKGNHRHFMAKEIHEQPEVVGRTLAHYLDMAKAEVALPFTVPFDWKDLTRLTISACGTAFLAGYIAKYWFERYARLPVEIDVASEFRYREAPLSAKGLALFISQSGETADTLAALRYAKENGQKILSVVNVTTSTIARESDIIAPILSGPEIGVASTKAFTCQLAVLACLAISAGVARGTLDRDEAARLVNELILTPGRISEALHREPAILDIAQRLTKATDVLYIGRGSAYPLAQEGALKLKEISYIHAEAYAAGELKHGPIALIDEKMPVIVIAPHDPLYEKTISNMQEVAARGGNIILIAEDEAAEQSGLAGIAHVAMPAMASDFAAIPYSVPIQLLAYWTAFLLGKDVDQPRNLAKSVTVE